MGESGRSPLAPLKGELSAKLTEGFYAEGTNSACGRGFSCRKAETAQSRLRRASSSCALRACTPQAATISIPFRGAKCAATTDRSLIERPSSVSLREPPSPWGKVLKASTLDWHCQLSISLLTVPARIPASCLSKWPLCAAQAFPGGRTGFWGWGCRSGLAGDPCGHTRCRRYPHQWR